MWSQGSVSCFNSARSEQTQGRPSLQPPTALQPFHQSRPLESATQLSASTRTSQHRFLSLALLPINHELPDASELFHQGEAAINRLVNMRLRVSYTYLSLGFYLNHDNMALEGVGHFSCELAKEECKGMECVLNMQNQHSGCALFLDMQEPPRDEWGKTQYTMEATLLMQKNPKQTLSDLHGLGSPHTDPASVTSWRTTPRAGGETYLEAG